MKFRKRPVVIEAAVFRGPEHPLPFSPDHVCCYDGTEWYIDTLEGEMLLSEGDWVIRDGKGELYPCKPDIFVMTYELAPEDLEVTP